MRLVPAAGCAWAAGALTTALPTSAVPLAAALWCVVALLAVAAAIGRHRPAGGVLATLAVALAASALVASVVVSMAPLTRPAELLGHGTRHGTATVRVASFVEQRAGAVGADADQGVAVRFSAVLESFGREGSSARVGSSERADIVALVAMPVTVLATVDDARAHPIGERLRLAGAIVPARDGDTRPPLLIADGAVEVVDDPPWWLAWAAATRGGFSDVARGLPGDGGDLLTGLVVGDDSELPADLDDAMLSTGLTHLTAVSGANCAIVVGMGVLVAAMLGAGLRLRLLVGGSLLVLFVVLVTPQPSVLRAAAMAVAVLVATATGRSRQGIPALALGVVVLVAIDARLALSAGFALSVAATAGLLLLASPLGGVLGRVMPRRLATVVAVPAAAQLACQPILFLLDPALALYAVPANLLAEPAAAFTTVTGSVLCILAAVAPPVAAVAGWVPWIGSAWIAAVARFFAGLPGAVIRPEGDPLATTVVVAVCCASAVAGLMLLARARRVGVCLLVSALVVTAGATALGAGRVVARSSSMPADWVVAACDIGQGDALLVRSAGRVALVDTGPDPEPLTRCLERLGLTRLDLLVLTHYDHDHVGGALAVQGLVDDVLVGPDPSGRGSMLRAALERSGARITEASRGMHGALGDLRWDVLWPRVASRGEGNDASVTVLFTGPLRMLFLGDLGESAQEGLRAAGPIPALDLVKVSHHGSADQSEALYRSVRATVGLISVGAGNDYGHPTDRVLEILARSGTAAFRTDLEGMVLVATGSQGIRVWTERAPPSATQAALPAWSGVPGRLQRSDGSVASRVAGGSRHRHRPPHHRPRHHRPRHHREENAWRPHAHAPRPPAPPRRGPRAPPRPPSRSWPGTRSGRLPSC